MANFISATDAEYNARTRSTEFKVELYLYGDLREPLIIDRDNFLIDCGLLEETNSEDSSPFGNVTANEVSIRLMNTDGIFSPTNTSSPYYGYIKHGIKLNVFIRPAGNGTTEYNWDKLGEFYVTDWDAALTSLTADITAADKLYSVFEQPDIKVSVLRDVTYMAFFTYIFNLLGESVSVDNTLVRMLTMAYSKDTNKELLNKATVGALSNCFCNHNGDVVVQSIIKQRPLRATLTDEDQIIDAGASQSSDTSYTGTSVTCNAPSESAPVELLSVQEFVVPVGTVQHNPISLSEYPMIRLISASLIGTRDAYVENIRGTSTDVVITTSNALNTESQMALKIIGTHIINTATTLSDNSTTDLVIDNPYVQTSEYAAYYKRVLQKYISSEMPVITVQVRGNPLLNLGDKIRIISEKYLLDFTGIIIRQELRYNGALSGTLTLLSDAILEDA